MRLRCIAQFAGYGDEYANVSIWTIGEGSVVKEEVWVVFRDQLEYDEDQMCYVPPWGIHPASTPIMTGTVKLTCRFLGWKNQDEGMAWVVIPTSDPSDSWRKMLVHVRNLDMTKRERKELLREEALA